MNRSPIKRVSSKRSAQLRTYTKLRREFLEAYPWCQSPANCGQAATDLHHMAGRVGAALLDTSRWMALCRPCHRWATEHPAEAFASGVSLRRIGGAA